MLRFFMILKINAIPISFHERTFQINMNKV